MKEFFNKVKTWIITHKVVSVVIAAVLVAGITLAIVLPVTLGGKKDNGNQATDGATYTVVWKNWDGTVLETDTDVKNGSIPQYNGATPARPSEGQTAYTFKGWSPELAVVTANVTYTATYTEGVDDTPKEPVYTVTETEYLAIKSKIGSHRNFIDGNFTVTLTYNGVSVNKFADGKFDGYIEGDHYVIVFDTATYDSTAKTANADVYYYDEDDKKWYREAAQKENLTQYYSYVVPFIEALPDSFDDLSYNADKREYSSIVTIDGENISVKVQFKDGKMISFTINGLVSCEFSDYGTTEVTVPAEYEDAKD